MHWKQNLKILGEEKENCWRKGNDHVCLLIQNLQILFRFYSNKSPLVFDKIWSKKDLGVESLLLKELWRTSFHRCRDCWSASGTKRPTTAAGFVPSMCKSSGLKRRHGLFPLLSQQPVPAAGLVVSGFSLIPVFLSVLHWSMHPSYSYCIATLRWNVL